MNTTSYPDIRQRSKLISFDSIDMMSLKPIAVTEIIPEKDALMLQSYNTELSLKISEPKVWVYNKIWVTYLHIDFETDMDNICTAHMIGFEFKEKDTSNEKIPASVLSALRTY